MPTKYESVGVVADDAIEMVDGVVVPHPDKQDMWIVARPADD